MAIVINGSGTVTGLSAGGLPDNTVDNGTMADDAVGVVELSATGTASSSTFLRGDNSWQSAADATKLPLAGGTMTGNILCNDNVHLRCGTNSDLRLYHDGTNSYIGNYTGTLYVTSGNGETSMRLIPDGAAELYHNDAKKLETSATGITVTGAIAGATNLGKILQVVYSNSSTATYPSTSFAAISSASITITPSATTSKILYIYNTGGLFNGNVQEMWLRMYRGGTTIRTYKRWGYASGQSGYQPLPWTWMYVDSPNTTSSIDYSLDAKENASAGWEINDTVGDGPGALVMAIEIGA